MTSADTAHQKVSPVTRIQNWYRSQCDGDWEHSYGLTIETLDNPGWQVTIDLADTPWAAVRVPLEVIERTDRDWVHLEVTAAKFKAAGGPGNLEELIELFFARVIDSPAETEGAKPQT